MDLQKFRVFNSVQEELLPLEVSVVDSVTIPLKKLLEAIISQNSHGIWLKPYRGIPFAPGLPNRDLVFLDENHCVVRDLEKFPSHEFRPFRVQPASALVLPVHTIFASQIRPGDQLEFRLPEAAKRRPGSFSEKSPSLTIAHGMDASPAMEQSEAMASAQSDHDGVHEIFANAILADADSSMTGGARLRVAKARLLRWLSRKRFDRRRANRYRLPGLVAMHPTFGAPGTCSIGNISETGLFLLPEERLSIGSTIWMKLQNADHSDVSIVSNTRVVRWGPDGMGMEFVAPEPVRGGILKALAVAV